METSTETALILAAQAGDNAAFDTLVAPYRHELLVYCYRLLGSVHDAEDLVQETLLRSWVKRATFVRQGSFRAWLYRIATNLCLNAITRGPRRSLPPLTQPPAEPTLPLPEATREPVWLEPLPDALLADLPDTPEAHYTQRESVTLAFIVALQVLPPRQRAVLVLRDVLDWPASEVAEWLEMSVPAVNSALQRARAALARYAPSEETQPAQIEERLRPLLDHYLRAWEQADVPALVALLKEDAWFTMPPVPAWFSGRDAIEAFFRAAIFNPPTPGAWRLLQVWTNASPAFALYRLDAATGRYSFFGLLVLTWEGEQIATSVGFMDVTSHAPFALPDVLTD
ncbi:MAG TPA: RNA polymerase subunit sigma-70 [Ktedonobacterales bacterium]|nr:RNA polymerase subunit sigma-70 [Ktedonobacterales bacterium]